MTKKQRTDRLLLADPGDARDHDHHEDWHLPRRVPETRGATTATTTNNNNDDNDDNDNYYYNSNKVNNNIMIAINV